MNPAQAYSLLRRHRNAERAQMERRIARSTLDIVGCGVPACIRVARQIVREQKSALVNGAAWFEFVAPYWEHPSLEIRIVAREVLVLAGDGCVHALTEEHVRHIANVANSWTVLDKFAAKLVGPAVLAKVLSGEFLLTLRDTDPAEHRGERDPRKEEPSYPGRFFRRCALVASTAFNTRQRTDIERPLELLDESVCRDRDTMTWKAVSWTLRSLAKNAPDVAEDFLLHPPAPLHPSVVREVRTVARTGLKSGRQRHDLR